MNPQSNPRQHPVTPLSPDIERVRGEFPMLAGRMNGHPLAYLDNGATAQKPACVIGRISRFYAEGNANIHRGVYALSQAATEDYENARRDVAAFIGAPEPRGLVFTKGTTEGMNLLAHGFAQSILKPGDEVLVSAMEHHANIVPWQLACQRSGAALRVIPIDDRGVLDLEAFDRLLVPGRTRLLSIVHVSNALGTVNPVKEMIALAHARGALACVDAAQSAPHMPVDVLDLGCDFLCFSGHKVFGPTGIGVLWGRPALLDALPPYQAGGDMIRQVSFSGTTFREAPERFEAGTPPIAGAIGLAEACNWLRRQDRTAFKAHENALLEYATAACTDIPGFRVFGTAPGKASVLSFGIDGVHPHDIGTYLDSVGIAIRTGHHCAQPLMERLGVAGTARASFAFYNTFEEADRLAAALRKAVRFFA